MRIILADDHAIFRQGLRSLLENGGSIKVIAEADDGVKAVALAEEMFPDIIIMDISMPGMNGLEATERIKKSFPEIKVIILSMHTDDIYIHQALKSGASGYVLKDAAYDELRFALEAVGRGNPYLSPAVMHPVVNEYLHSTPAGENMTVNDNLTPREKEVLQLLIKGYSRHEVANILCISPKTVDRHKGNLKEKLKDAQ